jgi:hypothetical protein
MDVDMSPADLTGQKQNSNSPSQQSVGGGPNAAMQHAPGHPSFRRFGNILVFRVSMRLVSLTRCFLGTDSVLQERARYVFLVSFYERWLRIAVSLISGAFDFGPNRAEASRCSFFFPIPNVASVKLALYLDLYTDNPGAPIDMPC